MHVFPTVCRAWLRAALLSAVAVTACAGLPPTPFTNFETPHVYPLDITPDRGRLLAVNLPENRLEIFSLTTGRPRFERAIPVGLDPVAVRARTSDEVWVVNHVSDSISIVSLSAGTVVATLFVGDEPTDVIFAGTPQRAFVCLSQLNQIKVYDPAALSAPPTTLNIEGEDPRALATDGVRVYAAIFESGNKTTALPREVVSSPLKSPYVGAPNPPPNRGTTFEPPINPQLTAPPPVGLIVRQQADGRWLDDNNGDWSPEVHWQLHDHDVAIIDANSLAVSYATGLMNLNMSLAVRPGGEVTVVGTEALNEVRFEPVVNGIFLRVRMGRFNGAAPAGTSHVDLNPHLDYQVRWLPPTPRAESIGDPRAIVWNAAGTVGYIAGMGSNNVIAINAAGARVGRVAVGSGPTGLALDEGRGQLYVLNKFGSSISTVNLATLAVAHTTPLYDSSPPEIKGGRPFLYDTHLTSGLGHVSCASCHVDARMDQVAWDLGNPAGEVTEFRGVCDFGIGGGDDCEPPHPMKGPMTTQTLVGLFFGEPFHWRGDRLNLSEFNVAYTGLQSRDSEITPTEMDLLEDFLKGIRNPPNPYRNFDGTLPTTFPNGGNPRNGETIFRNTRTFRNQQTCSLCHGPPFGLSSDVISTTLALNVFGQGMNSPQLRNMHEKTGFSTEFAAVNNRGFGYLHDGTIDTLDGFLTLPQFTFSAGATGAQQRRDLVAFMFCFAAEIHAAVGRQLTISSAGLPPADQTLLNAMRSLAASGQVGLVAKGRISGVPRGWRYNPGDIFQSDRAGETITFAALQALAGPAQPLTYTVVPTLSATRIGIDQDLDGYFDGDERTAGSDPDDPLSTPLLRDGDMNCDGSVNFDDLDGFVLAIVGPAAYQAAYPTCRYLNADLNDDRVVDFDDINPLVAALVGG